MSIFYSDGRKIKRLRRGIEDVPPATNFDMLCGLPAAGERTVMICRLSHSGMLFVDDFFRGEFVGGRGKLVD